MSQKDRFLILLGVFILLWLFVMLEEFITILERLIVYIHMDPDGKVINGKAKLISVSEK